MEHLESNRIVRTYAGRGRDALEDNMLAEDIIDFVGGKVKALVDNPLKQVIAMVIPSFEQ